MDDFVLKCHIPNRISLLHNIMCLVMRKPIRHHLTKLNIQERTKASKAFVMIVVAMIVSHFFVHLKKVWLQQRYTTMLFNVKMTLEENDFFVIVALVL